MVRAVLCWCVIIIGGLATAAEPSSLEKLRESIALNRMYDFDKRSFDGVAAPFLRQIKEFHKECEELHRLHSPSGFFFGTERENLQNQERTRNIQDAIRNQSIRINRLLPVLDQSFEQALRDFEKNIDDVVFRNEVIEHFTEQRSNTHLFINELSLTVQKGDFEQCKEQLALLLKDAAPLMEVSNEK